MHSVANHTPTDSTGSVYQQNFGKSRAKGRMGRGLWECDEEKKGKKFIDYFRSLFSLLLGLVRLFDVRLFVNNIVHFYIKSFFFEKFQ